MASILSIRSPRQQPASFSNVSNVKALLNQRAYLTVSMHCSQADQGQAQLRAMFHSALGVYVVDTRIEKGEIKVKFDIAIQDTDFTLHHLIRDLPEATIGRLEPKSFSQSFHATSRGPGLRLV